MAHNRPTTAPPITAEKEKIESLGIEYFDPGDAGSNPSGGGGLFYFGTFFSTLFHFMRTN